MKRWLYLNYEKVWNFRIATHNLENRKRMMNTMVASITHTNLRNPRVPTSIWQWIQVCTQRGRRKWRFSSRDGPRLQKSIQGASRAGEGWIRGREQPCEIVTIRSPPEAVTTTRSLRWFPRFGPAIPYGGNDVLVEWSLHRNHHCIQVRITGSNGVFARFPRIPKAEERKDEQ